MKKAICTKNSISYKEIVKNKIYSYYIDDEGFYRLKFKIGHYYVMPKNSFFTYFKLFDRKEKLEKLNEKGKNFFIE